MLLNVTHEPVKQQPQASTPYIFDGGGQLTNDDFLDLYGVDYNSLRINSNTAFTTNGFAIGIFRTLITNEINSGLEPEMSLVNSILGLSDDAAEEWADNTETLFDLWARDPKICDYYQQWDFSNIQRVARLESMISGDVLVILREDKETNLPSIQLISGCNVSTPILKGLEKTIEDGVEIDSEGRVLAYWVDIKGKHERIPAYGKRTGRRVAWLLYGSENRISTYRGMPLLGAFLSSLNEIDQYRESAQRKAKVSSFLAMFIKKNQDKPGSLPISNAAVKRTTVSPASTEPNVENRIFRMNRLLPGAIIEELQHGEEPVVVGSNGTDLAHDAFTTAIVSTIAWQNNIPPEILRKTFSSNYSASQAALNEYRSYLRMIWSIFGSGFCQPIYEEWLYSAALHKIIDAPGLVDNFYKRSGFLIKGAWTRTEWYGTVKPTTDLLKQVKGSVLLIENGLSTHHAEARTITGSKFTTNIKKLKKEFKLLREAIPDERVPTSS